MGLTHSRKGPGPGCSVKKGEELCKSKPNTDRCHNLDDGHYICICKPYYDTVGLNEESKCVKSMNHPDNNPDAAVKAKAKAKAFLEARAGPRSIVESLGGKSTTLQSSPPIGESSSMGGGGNEWLWGLGGFGAAIFLVLALFCIRWIVKLRKRGSKLEKEALISGETSYASAGRNGTPTTNAPPGRIEGDGVAV